LGQGVALAGLLLLLAANLARGQARRRRQPSPGLVRLNYWGSLVAFALILVGLGLMWLNR
jgi:hypothetical protein